MSFDVLIGVIQIILVATTPLVFAAIGELVTEKTGVLNLGVEGMMLVGAVTAFVTLVITGSYTLAFLVSLLSGALMSGLFAYLVLILMSNQVATILSLYHLGIEQGFIQESMVCDLKSGSNLFSKEDILKQLQEKSVSCKDVTFKILGLSLTTYNILISLIITIYTAKIYFSYDKN